MFKKPPSLPQHPKNIPKKRGQQKMPSSSSTSKKHSKKKGSDEDNKKVSVPSSTSEKHPKNLFGKFATVGSGTLLSRLFGLVRETLMAGVLATGPIADIFYTCFRFPNLFRGLFAEGAFNIAFVPLFAKEIESGGEDAARAFAGQVFAVLVSWLIVLTTLAIIFMPFLAAYVVAPGFVDTPKKFEMSVMMTRIMFPYLICMSLVAMFGGILNSARRYFLVSFAPSLLNIVLILVLCVSIFVDLPDRSTGLFIAWGVLFAGCLQLLVLVIGLRRAGLTFRLTFPRLTDKVKRLLTIMGPALMSSGVLQVNLLVGTIIATRMDGANALLNYADRLNQLPLGVIGVAVGVVLLPEMTRALNSDDPTQARHIQNRAMEQSLMLAFPASVGLIVLSDLIVSVVYERGAFDSHTTELTAQALRAFASGLPAYVLVKVLLPAFFARQNVTTPFFLSCLMVTTNIILSLLLWSSYGHVAIALATSISAWLHCILIFLVLRFGDLFVLDSLALRRLSLTLLFGVLMGLGLWITTTVLLDYPIGFLPKAMYLLVLMLLSSVFYFGGLWLTGGSDILVLRRR